MPRRQMIFVCQSVAILDGTYDKAKIPRIIKYTVFLGIFRVIESDSDVLSMIWYKILPSRAP